MLFIVFLIAQAQNFYLQNLQIEGEERVSQDFIEQTIGFQEGTKITPQTIRDAIKKLYRTGYFDQITVSALEEDSLINLKVKIKEHPRLLKLKLEGVYKLKEKDILEKLKPVTGEPISPQKVFSWKKRIKELYREKGFVGTSVSEKMIEKEKGIELILNIDEGKKARIKEIEVYGNSHYKDSKIEILLRNREKEWYRKAAFKEDYWEEDLPKISSFYKEQGFLNAKVDSYRMKELEENWIAIELYITEGKRFYLGEVTFEGDKIFSDKKLAGFMKLKKGDPLNYKKMQESIGEIQGGYADLGYLLVQVLPEENLKDSIVNYLIHIKKGPPVYVKEIIINGNTRTRDYVIRRELDIYPDTKFSRERLVKSQRDLYFMNFFEDVRVNFELLDDSTHVNLIFDVKEKPTGTIQAGASYSQIQGAAIFLQFTQPNLFGRGQILDVMAEYGEYRKSYRLSFTEPWLFNRPYAVGFDVHDLTSNYPGQFDEQRQGFSVFFSRPILSRDIYRWRVEYSLERINIKNISSAFKTSRYYRDETWPKISSRVSNSLSRDSRDRVFNERSGSRFSYTNTLSGWFLGGNINFHKHIVQGGIFIPFFKKHIIQVFKSKFGAIGVLKKGEQVPIYERFRPGGVFTSFPVRGYRDWSIGPTNRGDAIGGNYAFTFTYEFRVPLSENFYFLAFFDAGNAWATFNTFKKDWEEFNPPLYRGGGIGVRIQLPMLPVMGIDIGYGFDAKEGEERIIPHFQFGTQF